MSCFISFDFPGKGKATGFAFDFSLKNSKTNIELPSKFFSKKVQTKESKKSDYILKFEPKVPILGGEGGEWRPSKLFIRNIHFENNQNEDKTSNQNKDKTSITGDTIYQIDKSKVSLVGYEKSQNHEDEIINQLCKYLSM